MSAVTATRRGQRAAESLMADACAIRRKTGEVLDEDTLEVVPTYDTIYTGKCKIQAATSLASSAQEIGGQVVTVTTRYVHLPVSAPEVQVDDLVDVDSSLDAHLIGKAFRVTSPFAKSYATARRLEIASI